jgi:hypothetical protein
MVTQNHMCSYYMLMFINSCIYATSSRELQLLGVLICYCVKLKSDDPCVATL